MKRVETLKLKSTLRSLRIKFGYTQKNTAYLLGISASTLRKWEENSEVIPYHMIKKIEELYKTPQANIFFLA